MTLLSFKETVLWGTFILLLVGMLGPWPFVALCAVVAFVTLMWRGRSLRAKLSFFGVKAELEGNGESLPALQASPRSALPGVRP